MHLDRGLERHACADVYVKQVLCASAYTFVYTLATGCAYALMYVHFVHPALGNEGEGAYESTCSWRGGLFLKEEEIGVLSISSLFLTRVGVYVGVCVCIRTHTHTLHIWGTRL